MESKRKCIACGELKPRNELIKITKEHASGDIFIEPNSKTFGKSAYVCKNYQCIENSFKKNKINKILKTSACITKESLLNHTNSSA